MWCVCVFVVSVGTGPGVMVGTGPVVMVGMAVVVVVTVGTIIVVQVGAITVTVGFVGGGVCQCVFVVWCVWVVVVV